MKKKIIFIVILAAVGFGAWRLTHKTNFMYAGTVEATEVDISPQVNAVIAEVPVKEGETITKDQVIVNLAGEDIKLAAQLAEKDFKRAVSLHASGSMPDEAFERLRYKRDDAALRASWCTIKSPINGTVLDRYHEPGELVNPSMKLLTLGNLTEVWAYVYIPQRLLGKISLNMPVQGVIPELNMKTVEGRVSHIRDEAEFTPKNVQTREERTRLVYGIKILFDNKEGVLKPGMTVEVKLPS